MNTLPMNALQCISTMLDRSCRLNTKTFLRGVRSLVGVVFFLLSFATFAADYVVNTTNDTVGVSGQFSLRDAIIAANNNCSTVNNITFNFGATPTNASSGGVNYYQIKINYHDPAYTPPGGAAGSVATPLPPIRCPVNIDGYAGSPAGATTGNPRIELDGSAIASKFAPTNPAVVTDPAKQRYPAALMFVGRNFLTGAKLTTNNPDGSTVTGLLINNFPRQGIYLYGTDHVTITGNYLALDASGEKAGFANARADTPPPPRVSNDIRIEGSSYDMVVGNLIGSCGSRGGTGACLLDTYFNDNADGFNLCSPSSCRHPDIGSHDNQFLKNTFGLNKEGNCGIGGFTLSAGAGTPGSCNPDGTRSNDGTNSGAYITNRGNWGLLITQTPSGFAQTNNYATVSQNVFVTMGFSSIGAQGNHHTITNNIFGLGKDGNAWPNIGPLTNRDGGEWTVLVFNGSNGLAQGNIIAGSEGSAISVSTTDPLVIPKDNTISGNFLGTNTTGLDIGKGNFESPIVIGGGSGAIILNNVIAYNGSKIPGGILILPEIVNGITITPSNTSILSNSI